MKKKEKIIRMERDRFNRNMAQMAAVQSPALGQMDTNQSTATGADGQSRSKWAVLRSHIQQTMEQRPTSC